MSETSASKPRVAVVFGGRSDEHPISCITAGSVLKAIDRTRFDVVPVGITRGGRWVLQPDDPSRLALGPQGEMPEVNGDGPSVQIVQGADPGEYLVDGVGQGRVDVAFPLLHGPWGEDGTIQGQFEMAGITYVGSGVLASAVGMDKHYMKVALAAAGLPVMPHVLVTATSWRAGRDRLLAQIGELGLPLFVKPARGGSSFGISKVNDLAELDAAIALAAEHDPRILVEQSAGAGAREVECGVLQAESGTDHAVTPLAEIEVSGHEFYDLEAKYLPDQGTQITLPADLPADVVQHLQAMARRAFDAVSCEGLARVDFFVRADGALVINELNTMPGFTPTSQFPLMWAEAGVDYPALVDRLIRLALGRSTGLR